VSSAESAAADLAGRGDDVRDGLLRELGRSHAVGSPSPRPVSAEAVRRWWATMPRIDGRSTSAPVGPVPRSMLHSWVLPDPDDDAAVGWLDRVRAVTARFGLTHGVATNYAHEYIADVQVGDRLTARSWIESVSDRKRTRLGTGHFVASCIEVRRGDDVVGMVRVRNLLFRPAPATPSAAPPTPSGAVDGSTAYAGSTWTVALDRDAVTGHSAAAFDLDPIHHNRRAAEAAGFPDVVATVMTTLALVDQVAGLVDPGVRVSAIAMRMGVVLLPGDELVLSSERRAGQPGEDSLLVVGRNGRGPHVTAVVRHDAAPPRHARPEANVG
jgi:acyl dehydratase